MKQRNKVLALVLVVSMLAACLIGCGKEEQKDTTGSTTKATTKATTQSTTAGSTAATTEGTTEAAVEEPDPLKIDFNQYATSEEIPSWEGEKLLLTAWINAGDPGGQGVILPQNDVCLREVERVTGIYFNEDTSFDNGGNSFDATIGKIVAAGDYPHVGHALGQLDGLVDIGALHRLDEVIKEYAPTVYKYFGPDSPVMGPAWNDQMERYGGVYAVALSNSWSTAQALTDAGLLDLTPENLASVLGAPTHNKAIFKIREDVLLKLYPDALTSAELQEIHNSGRAFTDEELFDIPINSPEDFVQFLYDVKEVVDEMNDPNTYVWWSHEGSDNWPALATNAELFGYTGNYFAYYDMQDKGFKYTFEQDWFKDILRTYNQLIRDEVIPKESLIDTNAIFKEKMNNGQYVVLNKSYTPNNSKIPYRNVWCSYGADEDVFPRFGGGTSDGTTKRISIFTDDVTEEQLIQIVRYLEFVVSDPGMRLKVWGMSENYIINEDGTTRWNEELEARFLNGEYSKFAKELGILNNNYAGGVFFGPTVVNCHPNFYYPTTIKIAKTYTPAWLHPATLYLGNNTNIYSHSINTNVEGIASFWAARNGFESELTKVFAAADDAEFEKQYQKMVDYAHEYGLTPDTLADLEEYYATKVNPSFIEIMNGK